MIYDPSSRPLIKKLLSARAIGLIKILPKIKNIMIQLMIDINASLLKISLLYKKSSLFKCIYNNITCIQADIEVAKARKA